MAGDDRSVARVKTIPRKLLSVVCLLVATTAPVAVVISITHHHWLALFVCLVASAVQVPLAIAITRQSGPAMKLIGPIVLGAVLGYVMIGFALG
jgi:hypothetical protein